MAILPGSDFGFSDKKMIARLSFTDFDGKNFLNKINIDTKINEELLLKYAPMVVEGANRIRSWSIN